MTVCSLLTCVVVSMIEDTLALLGLNREQEEFAESGTNAVAGKNRTPNRIQRGQTTDVPDES